MPDIAPPSKDQILAALRTIHDDGSTSDVVAAGQIHGIVIDDGHVGFSIEVPAADGARKEPLRQACEHAVANLPGVSKVTAVLTAHNQSPGQSPTRSAEHAAEPQPARPEKPSRINVHASQSSSGQPAQPQSDQQNNIPGIDHIIAVASGKGGVGKSTVAVNLAIALANQGKRVGLLDADIYGPSIPQMLGLKDKPQSDGKKILPHQLFGIKVMSIGFMVDEDQAMIWRGPMVMSALTQMLNDVAWGELDVLVVDMPPGTGDAQLTLAQRAALSGAVIVSTPQEVALADVRRGIAMFEKTHVPILGLVENMAYFISPDGQKTFIFGEGGVKRTAEKFGVDVLAEVPLYTRIRETGDAGTPISASAPDSAEAAPFHNLARHVITALETRTAPAFPTIRTGD